MQVDERDAKATAISMLSTIALSFLGSVVVTFLFVTVFLREVAAVSLTDSFMFVAPIFVGFLLGLIVADKEIPYVMLATITTTLFTVALTWVALFSPQFFGTGVLVGDLAGWAYKDLMLVGIITFPLILVSGVLGKFVGETSFYSDKLKEERTQLRKDTIEWYAMLETVEGDKLKDDLEAPLEWRQSGPSYKPMEPPKKEEATKQQPKK